MMDKFNNYGNLPQQFGTRFFLDINSLFELKLIIKPFPTLNIKQYYDLHKINIGIDKEDVLSDIKEYIDNLTLEVYKRFKDSLMYKEDIKTSKGTIKLEDIHKKHLDLLYLTKTVKGKYSRDDYYKNNNFEKVLINEIERQRAIWYYYKVSKRVDLKDRGKRILKPKVLDGFLFIKRKS